MPFKGQTVDETTQHSNQGNMFNDDEKTVEQDACLNNSDRTTAEQCFTVDTTQSHDDIAETDAFLDHKCTQNGTVYVNGSTVQNDNGVTNGVAVANGIYVEAATIGGEKNGTVCRNGFVVGNGCVVDNDTPSVKHTKAYLTSSGDGENDGEKDAFLEHELETVAEVMQVVEAGIEEGSLSEEEKRRAYHHKLAHTVCICIIMMANGWSQGLLGPTFPDIRLIIDEDLTTASWILTGWSFGTLIGSVVGGFAYDRLHKIRLFVSVVMILGVVMAATPWCENFIAMLIVHIGIGVFGGILKTAACTDMAFVWRAEARSYIQAVSGMVCIGSIISPIVSEPFLAKRIYPDLQHANNNTLQAHDDMNNFNASLLTQWTNYATMQPFDNLIMHNATLPWKHVTMETSVIGEVTDAFAEVEGKYIGDYDIESEANGEVYGETSIHISYAICCAICFLAAFLYLGVLALYGNVYTKAVHVVHTNTGTGKGTDHRDQYPLRERLQTLIVLIMAIGLMFYIMAERSMTQYLMTFLVSSLKWTKTEGANSTSLFWVCVAVGRFLSVFIVHKLKISTWFILYLLLLLCGVILLWVSVTFVLNPLVWASVCVIALGMSPLFGFMMALLSERVCVLSGKISAVLFIFVSIGGMISPILLAFLMDKVAAAWFVYFQILAWFIVTSFMLLVFILLNFLLRKYKASTRNTFTLTVKVDE